VSRYFAGGTDVVNWTLAADLTGAWTFAHILKVDAGVTWASFCSQDSSANASILASGRQGTNGTFAMYSGGGVNTKEDSALALNGWVGLAASRPAGAGQTIRFMNYPIGGSPTFSNSASPHMDNAATQAGGKTVFGEIDNADFFKGRLADNALWSTNLNDSQMQSLVDTMTLANWLSLSPAALWDERDAFNLDQTPNGKNRTLLTGTSDDADNPTGWASWAAAASPPVMNPETPLPFIYLRANR
jgi:hypothetical protein